MTQPTKTRKRRRIFLLLIAGIFALCIVGWFWLNATVKSKLKEQLVAAGIDSPQVGSVQTGLGGFTARNIQFESGGASVSFDSLNVHQSILDLARGVEPMDAVSLQGGIISIDSNQLDDDSGFSLEDLDLESLQIPANLVSAEDLRLEIFDKDRSIAVSMRDLSLTGDDESLDLTGNATFLDGELQFHGEVIKASGDLNVDFTGNQLHLADQKWQLWPGISPGLEKYLGADSLFDVVGDVNGNLKNGVNYKANITTKDAWLYIPTFDLPIAIRSADILIQDGLATYQKVVAAMGDEDVVNGTGTTSIDCFPCVSKFEGDFSNVDVADLRKLVPEIPEAVVGTVTGKVTGSVDVDELYDTTLRLSAAGDTNEALYGEIKTDKGFVDVQIQPLVLTQLGEVLDLQGSVTVDASTKQQDVDGVLATFDLEALDQQFEFNMLGDADVDLLIPLNSADDLRTWTLEIDSTAKSASVSGLELENLTIKSYLEEGQLVFKPAKGNLRGDPDAFLDVNVVWPMPVPELEEINTTGTINVAAVGLQPREAAKFFSRQMKNAGVEYEMKPQVDRIAESDIKGSITVTSSIEIPSGPDRPIDSWKVDATISNSEIGFADETLQNIGASLSINQGEFELKDLTANVADGGGIRANASLNLNTSELHDVALLAKDFPASWLAQGIVKEDSTGKFENRTGLNSENVGEQLSGMFNAKIEMDPEDSGNILWSAHSDELTIFGSPFRNIDASGHYDTQLDIERIDALLPGGGEAHLNGDWIAGSDEGKFNLTWKKAELAPLLESQISLPESFASLSDGELEITFKDAKPEFAGEFDLIEPQMFGGTFADHRFEISTTEGRIHFREIPDKKNKTVSLIGSFAMEKPYKFDLKGKSNALPLSTSAFDKLSGIATMDFQMIGEASPWNVQSSGESLFENLRFDKSKLSNIQSKWSFDSSKLEAMELSLEGFGGTATLEADKSQEDELVFKIDDLELGELAAFRKLPAEFSGNVSGKAKVQNWQSPNQLSFSVTGESEQIRVANARLNRATGSATLSNGGKDLEYAFACQLIDGKLEGSGKTKLDSVTDPFSSTFPLNVKLSNGRLNRLVEAISQSPTKELKELQGRVSVSMDWEVTPGKYPKGSGLVSLDDIKYRNRLVSRKISSEISLNDGIMQLKRISADLQQGEISGNATIPLVGNTNGNYQLAVRNFSLPRLLHVLIDDPVEASGLVNARIAGRVGRTITGSGTLGVSQAGLFGVASESLKIPIRFRVEPFRARARIEMPKTRVKAFRGTIDGSAKLEIGNRLQFETKLDLGNLDSQTFIRSLTGYRKSGNGKLGGSLELSARNFRSEKDLTGSFRGELKQSSALSLPLLDQLSRFLGNAGTLRNESFESDAIDLTMSKGRIDIRQFRLQNALTSILITGSAWLNGKLDLEVAARVERINQPTLIDQLAGSPIARAVGPQAAFFAQAADFLSERIVFLDVTGTASRPQFRLNPGKQLREEAIRYFLRGSQILPNANGLNN